MEIIINGQTKKTAESLSVQQLLDIEVSGKQKGIAVAVNDSVVPRADWSSRFLSQNDNVLIIKATQGG